jgi:hypothetical protein
MSSIVPWELQSSNFEIFISKKTLKILEDSSIFLHNFCCCCFFKEKNCENFSISEDNIIISVEGRYPKEGTQGLLSSQPVGNIPYKPVLYFFG